MRCRTPLVQTGYISLPYLSRSDFKCFALAYAGKRALTLLKTEKSVVHGTSISKLRFWKCINRRKSKHLPPSTANLAKVRTRRGTGSSLHMEKRTNRSIPEPSIQHDGLTKWRREQLPQALRQPRHEHLAGWNPEPIRDAAFHILIILRIVPTHKVTPTPL